MKGKSTWKTTKGLCDLGLKTINHKLLLATQTTLEIEFSEETAFTNWPNIQGLDGHDNGNYISVILLAWAYILSAKWAELLQRSSDHNCAIKYVSKPSPSETPGKVAIEIGGDFDDEEGRWWNAILTGDKGWKISVRYKDKEYLSPWSISTLDGACVKEDSRAEIGQPPSSDVALKYLSKFCAHHRLYGQCSAALASALYIPLLSGRRISLPMPKPAIEMINQTTPVNPSRNLELVRNHGRLLPYYMSLSTNVWGMRSLLCSTFFNPDIPCNLVSAWLNPAFAIIDPFLDERNMDKLAAILGRRQPRLAALWLGAIIMGMAKTVIRDLKNGLSAPDLHAAAWTGSVQSFITLGIRTLDRQMISREDECRLLFITATSAADNHSRVPVYPWKPFGKSHIRDTELEVQQHIQCNCHCLEYEAWHWSLTNGRELQDAGIDQVPLDGNMHVGEALEISRVLHDRDLSSNLLSEGATCGIFGWLRSTGYPACEKSLYQHSWFDVGSSDGEDSDSGGSDIGVSANANSDFIATWLGGVMSDQVENSLIT
jgi:hypothetical protein